MLGKRVASAAVLIPVVVVLVYLGGIGLFVLSLSVALLAGYEYTRMACGVPGSLARRSLVVPADVLVLSSIALLVCDAQWPHLGLFRWVVLFLPLVALGVQVFHRNAPGSLTTWALTVAGSVYIGYPLAHFVKLRALDQGMYWLGLALVGTWVCDSGAFFVGRSFGKHKLASRISPHKTWEGAAGGLLFGASAVAVLGRSFLGLGWMNGVLMGVALVVGATLGDLGTSVIKRQVGMKDTSSLIPGHGGMLDRLDSLLFVIPIVYCFATIVPR